MKVVGYCLGLKDVVSVLAIGEVILGQICSASTLKQVFRDALSHYPDKMSSSSIPYSFMCCRPQPSLIRFGTIDFRTPVRFGV